MMATTSNGIPQPGVAIGCQIPQHLCALQEPRRRTRALVVTDDPTADIRPSQLLTVELVDLERALIVVDFAKADDAALAIPEAHDLNDQVHG